MAVAVEQVSRWVSQAEREECRAVVAVAEQETRITLELEVRVETAVRGRVCRVGLVVAVAAVLPLWVELARVWVATGHQPQAVMEVLESYGRIAQKRHFN